MVKFTVFHTFVYRARAFVSAFTAPILADHKKPEVERVLWWGVSPGQAILASRPIQPVVKLYYGGLIIRTTNNSP